MSRIRRKFRVALPVYVEKCRTLRTKTPTVLNAQRLVYILFNTYAWCTSTPGLHNKIPPRKIFARVWVAQEPFFSKVAAKIFQGLGPKRRESCNGDWVYAFGRLRQNMTAALAARRAEDQGGASRGGRPFAGRGTIRTDVSPCFPESQTRENLRRIDKLGFRGSLLYPFIPMLHASFCSEGPC